MFVTVVYLNIVNDVFATSVNTKQLDQKRYLPASFGRFGTDPSYLVTNHPYYDDNVGRDVMFFKKRQLKKKWAKLFQRSQSPYTIAFPALIRTR